MIVLDKFFYFNDLFSIYKELLTQKEQEIFSLYYEENLSMGEISENRCVSRSFVGNTVKTVERKLTEFEGLLHLFEIRQKILKICDKIEDKDIKEELESVVK